MDEGEEGRSKKVALHSRTFRAPMLIDTSPRAQIPGRVIQRRQGVVQTFPGVFGAYLHTIFFTWSQPATKSTIGMLATFSLQERKARISSFASNWDADGVGVEEEEEEDMLRKCKEMRE